MICGLTGFSSIKRITSDCYYVIVFDGVLFEGYVWMKETELIISRWILTELMRRGIISETSVSEIRKRLIFYCSSDVNCEGEDSVWGF